VSYFYELPEKNFKIFKKQLQTTTEIKIDEFQKNNMLDIFEKNGKFSGFPNENQ